MKRYEKGELAKEILTGLVAGGFVIACFAFPGFAQVAALFNPKDSYERHRIRQAVRCLEKKKYVRIFRKNGKDVIEITKSGNKRVLAYRIEEMKLKIPEKWGGWWYIIMFDIPEKKKRWRDAMSFRIKEFGLYPIQKSIFVSPYHCKDEIDFIGEFFKVRDSIIYIKAKEIEGAEDIKKYFQLS